MSRQTSQTLGVQLAQAAGVTRREAETFIRAFCQTVVDGASQGQTVKIAGLGSFKAKTVADRESIDVATGERITIPGYSKLSFSPDPVIAGQITHHAFPLADKPALLPEEKPATAVAAKPVVATLKPTANVNADSDNAAVASSTSRSRIPIWGIIAVVALVAIVIVAVVSSHGDRQPESQAVEDSSVVSPSAEVAKQTSADNTASSQPEQKVHVLQKGESLTTISVHYYGTPDSMRAIWNLNHFDNPNDIPLGTKILLP